MVLMFISSSANRKSALQQHVASESPFSHFALQHAEIT